MKENKHFTGTCTFLICSYIYFCHLNMSGHLWTLPDSFLTLLQTSIKKYSYIKLKTKTKLNSDLQTFSESPSMWNDPESLEELLITSADDFSLTDFYSCNHLVRFIHSLEALFVVNYAKVCWEGCLKGVTGVFFSNGFHTGIDRYADRFLLGLRKRGIHRL